MELQKGSRNKWSVNKLRELLYNYVCATERAEELSHSKETKHETESSCIVINGRNLRTPQQNIRRKLFHGWASAELPRNRVNVNLFLRNIRDLSR